MSYRDPTHPLHAMRKKPPPPPHLAARRALRKWAARPPTPPSPSAEPTSVGTSSLPPLSGVSSSTDRDGPRSLGGGRNWQAEASYSALARVPSERENIGMVERDRGLTRSDSLLNRARRVFSLPPSLRGEEGGRRGGGISYARKKEKEKDDEGGRENVREEGEERELTNRVRQLEDELEASRVREGRLRKRVAQLEEEREAENVARPAVESIVKSALRHFEAKEAALKDTIAKMDHDYASVVNEKNEAVRLLTAFVGRGRSPPASLSSVSEGGEGYIKDARRTISVDTYRRSSPTPRSIFSSDDLRE